MGIRGRTSSKKPKGKPFTGMPGAVQKKLMPTSVGWEAESKKITG